MTVFLICSLKVTVLENSVSFVRFFQLKTKKLDFHDAQRTVSQA